jgi:hypothetical protein
MAGRLRRKNSSRRKEDCVLRFNAESPRAQDAASPSSFFLYFRTLVGFNSENTYVGWEIRGI